jgi:hypothetical protein
VDVITALKALTIWAAYQHFEEKEKGSIETGKLADLVILSDDPTRIPADELEKIRIVETIKEGSTIFALTAQEQRRGDLMLPGGSRDDPFQRFIYRATAQRDFARADSPFLRGIPGVPRAMPAAPHDPGCVHQMLFDLVNDMLGQTG